MVDLESPEDLKFVRSVIVDVLCLMHERCRIDALEGIEQATELGGPTVEQVHFLRGAMCVMEFMASIAQAMEKEQINGDFNAIIAGLNLGGMDG